MIIANSLTALIYLYASGPIMRNRPNTPAWVAPVLVAVGIANVVFSVALFQWKRWGFFGCVGTSILVLVINLKLGLNIVLILLGLLGIVVLYAVLQIGGEKKGWTQLE